MWQIAQIPYLSDDAIVYFEIWRNQDNMIQDFLQLYQLTQMSQANKNSWQWKKDCYKDSKNVIKFETDSESQKQQLILILPVNYCLTVNNINQIDIQNATSQVNAMLRLGVYYKNYQTQNPDLQQLLIKNLLENMEVELSQRENIQLIKKNKNVQIIDKRDKGMLIFNIRQDFGAIFSYDVFLTPIQDLKLLFSIKLHDIELKHSDLCESTKQPQKPVLIKFNLLQFQKNKCSNEKKLKYENTLLRQEGDQLDTAALPDINLQYNYGSQVYFGDELNIGEYQIATNQAISQTSIYVLPYKIAKAHNFSTTKKINQKKYALRSKQQQNIVVNGVQLQKFDQQQSRKAKQFLYNERLTQVKRMVSDRRKYKLRSFNMAHFSITMFRYPLIGITTTLFPLLTIAFLNWAVFAIPTTQDEQDIKRLIAIITIIAAYISIVSVIRGRIPPTDRFTLLEFFVFSQLIPSFCATFELMQYRQSAAPNFTVWHIIAIIFTFVIVIAFIFYLVYFYGFLFKKHRSKFTWTVNPSEDKYFEDMELWQNIRSKFYYEDLQKFYVREQQQEILIEEQL